MKKLISLLKATMSGEMNIFKVNIKNEQNSKMKKFYNFIIIIFLVLAVSSYSFTYAMIMAESLSKIGMTNVMLSLFTVVISLIVLLEGIYKSQGILFDAKDNDLLFSMPIPKGTIFMSRLIKVLAFEYIFDFIFMIPAYISYIIFENPGVNFYIISLIMLILIPIIPTIIGCMIGYAIKAASSVFQPKKAIQIVSTLVITMGILFFSFTMQTAIADLIKNAESIGNKIEQIYYPIQAYNNIIKDFSIVDLLILFGINIIPGILFVKIFSIYYFKTIEKSSKITIKSKGKTTYRKKSQLSALILKDLKRYFSSPIYVMNTIFGLLLFLIIAICVSANFDGTMEFVVNTIINLNEGMNVEINSQVICSLIPQIFICTVLGILPMSIATSSIISTEGKRINIIKSLPVSTKKILLAKTLMGDIIAIPILLIISLIFIFRFNISILASAEMILSVIIASNFFSIFELFVNLKFPMMDAKNDTMIVKQSASVFVCMFVGFIISAIPIILGATIGNKIGMDIYIFIALGVMIIMSFIMWHITKRYGEKRIMQL